METWKISVKGCNAQMFQDPVLKKKYQDVVYGYGIVLFTGTSDQCDEFEMVLFNKGFKILGTEKCSPSQDVSIKKNLVKALLEKADNKFWRIHLSTDETDDKLYPTTNGSRNWSKKESEAMAVYKRIRNYYIKNFITHCL